MGDAIGYAARKARKRYQCWWCAEPIEPGTQYVRWGWADEGTVSTVRVHPECGEAWSDPGRYGDDGVNFGAYSRGCTCEHGRCECEKGA